jgi:DNA polymerase zeta
LVPNPQVDEISMAFWSFQPGVLLESESCRSGILAVEARHLRQLRHPAISFVSNELELLNALIDTVMDLDPDMVVGWEIQDGSWGYVAARAGNYGKSRAAFTTPD